MDRPTVYLLPGLLCDKTVWSAQHTALSAWADVLGPDFRGSRSLRDMAAAVLAEAPEHFSVAGHSMGGRVALEMHRAAPERVDRIALLSTSCRPADGDEPARRKAFIDIARRDGMTALASAWLPRLLHPDHLANQDIVDAISRSIESCSLVELEGQIEALLERADDAENLRGIRCPALIACGREDAWGSADEHRTMASVIPHATLAIIERCGHMAPMEQPDEVNRLLVEWMQNTGEDTK
ncbi:MAG: alpha/beta fold hydrolase [Chthoniobacterales bacterium]